MERPVITPEHTETLLETKFIKVYDLQYAPGRHYYDATRRQKKDLIAFKSDEEALAMQPDAVSCCVVVITPGAEPRILLTEEYRYPAGRFLLSIPSGLIDPEDRAAADPVRTAAAREIHEETGLTVGPADRIDILSPFLYSSPGMTDESNALVCAVLHPEDLNGLSDAGAVGGECFNGFVLYTREEARALLKTGRAADGHFFSVFTWMALTHFVWVFEG